MKLIDATEGKIQLNEANYYNLDVVISMGTE